MSANRFQPVECGSESDVTVAGRDYVVAWIASGEAIYTPARLTGHPDNMYPAEGECNVTNITCVISDEDGNDIAADSDIGKVCAAALDHNKIEDALWDAFMNGRD